jgi:uncharacterized protein (UPF0147 family)
MMSVEEAVPKNLRRCANDLSDLLNRAMESLVK